MVNIYKRGAARMNKWQAGLGRMLFFSACFLFSLQTFAQEYTVRGKVTDNDSGEALPGATVQLKGSNTGVVTDINGSYSISVPQNATLVFSYIGYSTKEIVVGSKAVVDVSLPLDIESLSEVVVVGYGTVQKRDVTGVVAQVGPKDFNRGVISSPDKLLDGKVAGLQMVGNGEPGGGMGIRLRGVSLNGETPLFVIDGVPLEPGGVTGGRNPLNFINPSDVQDITVLKDASAAAIYGSRGANGVIMITTKSGQTGKPKFSYDSFYSLSVPVRQIDMLSPTAFRRAIALKAPDRIEDLGDANTFWMDEVTRLASSQQHNFTGSGGFKKTTYYGSLSYLQNNGVLRFTQNENINLAFKVSQKLFNDKLSLRLNTKNGITNDLYGPNVIGSAAIFDPTRPIRVPGDTIFGGYFQWPDQLANSNPVAAQEQLDQSGKTFRSLTNFELEYQLPFVDGLSFKANLSYDRNDGSYRGMAPANSKQGFVRRGNVQTESNIRTSEVYEYYGNYKRSFADHKIDLVGGYSYQNSRSDYFRTTGNAIIPSGDFFEGTENVEDFEQIEENRLISFFGRANYDYAGKYLITASVRRDGSSRFGESNRWGIFPAVAVGWRILDENFADPLNDIFSDLKFRVSYGIVGNQEIGNYRYSTFYRLSEDNASYQFGDEYVNTLRPIGVDPNIKWEQTASTNIGLDFGILKGRLSGSVDYFDKKVTDLLFRIAVPAGSNLSDVVLTNIGEVSNKGVELQLNAVAVDRSDFRWDIGYNISYVTNKIVKLDNLEGDALREFPGYESGGISGDVGQTIQVRRVGYPIDVFRTYIHNRDANGNLITDPNGDGIQSLLEMYKDVNGDGIINELDKVPGKQPFPSVIMGITSTMTVGKWDFSSTMKASFGNYVYNNTASNFGHFRLMTDRVTNNIHSSAFVTNFKDPQLHSDFYVENGSFLKMDNITVGYNFGKVRFIDLRMYTTVQNAFMITGYSGVDPEVFNGIDNNLYPRSTSFVIGLNATF